MHARPHRHRLLVASCLQFVALADITRAETGLRAVATGQGGTVRVEYRENGSLVGRSGDTAPAGVALLFPEQPWQPLAFPAFTQSGETLEMGPFTHSNLVFRWRLRSRAPGLVERILTVNADSAARFTVSFPIEPALGGRYASFSGAVTNRQVFDTVRGGKWETFPAGMLLTSNQVFGVIADSPGLWENRCQILIDPAAHQLAVMTGDGRASYDLVLKPPEDARDTYQYRMDGWQSLAAGETRTYTTWVFASAAQSHYDGQLAAHLAVANAKGWNNSAVEAILRNTSLYLLRRNLALDADSNPRDGRYIFVSGPGYGWKQWVSDGFWAAIGLDDPEKTIESNRAVFWNRMDYEENSQYYLIWAALMKRAGGKPNPELTRQAYDFIRHHETNGLYVPPPLPGAPSNKGWKTYMDVLEYDDDDCPASNQGFHCGALMAALELGLPVTEADIQKAISGYQGLFNRAQGFMPTSRKKQDTLGQDTLYGATLTYAVFGRKILTDEQVLTHYRTSEHVKSPYGLRVISRADGTLLPGHSGQYVFGGSWFLCDASNYLLAGVHGLPSTEVDDRLIARIRLEIRDNPAFNEDIETVGGKPHGHILYSWNSGYPWLRREIRRRLGQSGPDAVETAIDRQLGVSHEGGSLSLAAPRPDR